MDYQLAPLNPVISFQIKPSRFLLLAVLQMALLISISGAAGIPVQMSVLLALSLPFFLLVISKFEIAIRIFMISLLLNYYLLEDWGITPADIMGLILVANFGFKLFITRQVVLKKTPLDKAILIFLIVLGISLMQAENMRLGLINYARHIELFIVFFAIYNSLEVKHIRKLVELFLILVGLNSLYSLGEFILKSGQERVFAETGNAFADMLVPAFLICYIMFFVLEGRKKRIKLAIAMVFYLLALLATGTRGALVSLAIGFILSNAAMARRKILSLRTVASVITVLLVVFLVFLFTYGYRTSHSVVTPYGNTIVIETMQVRFVLWYMALKTFLAHPVMGIGLNQFLDTARVFPSAKNSPLFPYIKGMDAHSTVLNYLVNTGLVGTLALLYFFYSILKVSWRNVRSAVGTSDHVFSLSLAVVLTYVVFSSFYAGMWFWSLNGLEFMLFLSLAVRCHKSAVDNRSLSYNS